MLMKIIENGDKLIITRLNRIAQSLIHGVQLLQTLSERGVIVEVLNMGVIDDTPTFFSNKSIILRIMPLGRSRSDGDRFR